LFNAARPSGLSFRKPAWIVQLVFSFPLPVNFHYFAVMGNYIVSARKYRPKGFEEVVGQEHITTTLQNAVNSGKPAQAMLFCGPRGVGKTTCARILARLVNNFDAPGEGGSNPLNIYELDAASNNSVEDIRNLIDQVRYPPQFGVYKVYIIDEVHMLSNAAFNAFLKTLEEPPPYAIFILATTEKHKVIPTILSRCQIYDFKRIQPSDIAKHLSRIAEKEEIRAEDDALHLIAQKSDGALRDALSMFDLIVAYSNDRSITYPATIQHLHILDYDYYFQVTDQLLAEDGAAVLLTFDEILAQGFDGQNFILGLASHFRDLMMCMESATLPLLQASESVKARYSAQAARVSYSFLLSALNITNACDLNYKGSKNQRLHVEITLLKLAHLHQVLDLSGISEAAEVKKKA
jgi:DNA polymerase III subunit gamma/tau